MCDAPPAPAPPTPSANNLVAPQEDVSNLMSDEFTSKIVTEFKENNGRITRGDTTFRLATDYGFCWGVERAVAMAFQARQHFPDQVFY